MRASIRPIKSNDDYEAALAEIEVLWGSPVGSAKGDRLDVLATLVDAYEAKNFPMDPPDPIEAIKFRMEQRGLSRKDLEGIVGTRTRIAEVFNRKRSLSIGMIRRLHRSLGIPAEILIRPTRRPARTVGLGTRIANMFKHVGFDGGIPELRGNPSRPARFKK